MNKLLYIGFILLISSVLADVTIVPQIPTRAEADLAIATEMQARQAREADRKASIEAVTAIEEWEVDRGVQKTILRRVAPPIPHLRDEANSENLKFEVAPSTDGARTEEELAVLLAEQPIHRNLNLTALVFDDTFTEITWRDDNHREWTVLSNIDFRYLGGMGSFEDDNYYWSTFLFVYEVDSNNEADIAQQAAAKGYEYEPRTADSWLSLIPEDFLVSGEPEYLIVTSSPQQRAEFQISNAEYQMVSPEARPVPVALYEELDALHAHYKANEERLIAEFKRSKVLNEARRAWHEANPPEPKDTVINFWKVR